MGLFGRKKGDIPKNEAAATPDPTSGFDAVDPLAGQPAVPQSELAAPTMRNRRQAPTTQQKAYFDQIQRERATKRNSTIANALIESGLLSSDMVESLRLGGEEAASLGSVRQQVVQTGFLREDDFMEVLSDALGMERVDLQSLEITPELLAQVPKEVATKHKVFPVSFTEDTLKVAIADPMNIQTTDDLERILRKQIIGMVSSEEDIERFIKRFYEGNDLAEMYQGMTSDMHSAEAAAREEELMLDADVNQDAPPVVKFVDLIFKQAVHDRASDIHIEPHRTGVTIRFRIDGVCHEVPSPPKKWQNAIISRLKVLSGMDLAEKRIPQDGRIKLNLPDRKLDLRVSALPAIYGESIVMRILDQSSVILGLEDVGFLPDNIRIFKELIRSPTGVILMTGPTGSGKTTTLYSALAALNNPETKIITIENPVEYMLDGVNQIQVNEEVGLDFKTGLRSMLRQSPDVILVGEIRDQETAEIAIRAALTGHLVFSTLHTNDAPSAASRLVDMGVKPFLVASSVQAVIAQRLIRRLCSHCKRQQHIDIRNIEGIGASSEDIENGVVACVPVGCDRCSGSGYRGRTAIHEIFVLTPKLRQLVIRGEPSARLKRIAIRNGMRSLRMDGWKKLVMGQTSVEELDRVTAAD